MVTWGISLSYLYCVLTLFTLLFKGMCIMCTTLYIKFLTFIRLVLFEFKETTNMY